VVRVELLQRVDRVDGVDRAVRQRQPGRVGAKRPDQEAEPWEDAGQEGHGTLGDV
jgi:hypothetical protein